MVALLALPNGFSALPFARVRVRQGPKIVRVTFGIDESLGSVYNRLMNTTNSPFTGTPNCWGVTVTPESIAYYAKMVAGMIDDPGDFRGGLLDNPITDPDDEDWEE